MSEDVKLSVRRVSFMCFYYLDIESDSDRDAFRIAKKLVTTDVPMSPRRLQRKGGYIYVLTEPEPVVLEEAADSDVGLVPYVEKGQSL